MTHRRFSDRRVGYERQKHFASTPHTIDALGDDEERNTILFDFATFKNASLHAKRCSLVNERAGDLQSAEAWVRVETDTQVFSDLFNKLQVQRKANKNQQHSETPSNPQQCEGEYKNTHTHTNEKYVRQRFRSSARGSSCLRR